MTLHPAVAAVRRPIRAALEPVEPGTGVVVACSGGADSLALLAGTVFEAHKAEVRVIGATVDHGLQDGSAEHASRVVEQMAALGTDETVAARVRVDGAGLGPEAAARQARYAVLGQIAESFACTTVLLGHTRDDQAETVLLGLTRGSGGRSIAGMRRSYVEGGVRFVRPLLDAGRDDTETACQVEGIRFWSDPHNTNPVYTRSRLRQRVLPVLEDELGPGVAAALARTADGLREDTEYLDDLADTSHRRLGGGAELPIAGLVELAAVIRRRVLRLAALAAGSPPAELTRAHVLAVDALLTDWRGQRWIDLPGHLRAVRSGGVLQITTAPKSSDRPSGG